VSFYFAPFQVARLNILVVIDPHEPKIGTRPEADIGKKIKEARI
jgi:hypothetical protein